MQAKGAGQAGDYQVVRDLQQRADGSVAVRRASCPSGAVTGAVTEDRCSAGR